MLKGKIGLDKKVKNVIGMMDAISKAFSKKEILSEISVNKTGLCYYAGQYGFARYGLKLSFFLIFLMKICEI